MRDVAGERMGEGKPDGVKKTIGADTRVRPYGSRAGDRVAPLCPYRICCASWWGGCNKSHGRRAPSDMACRE